MIDGVLLLNCRGCNVEAAEVRVDGAVVSLTPKGNFEWQGFVPAGGKPLLLKPLTLLVFQVQQVRLERGNRIKYWSVTKPNLTLQRYVKKNRNALALVIGVADYKYTSDPALYADKDAEYFHDYAAIKLGAPDKNIFTITNTEADEVSIKKAVKTGLFACQQRTRLTSCFVGHGSVSWMAKHVPSSLRW